MQKYRSAFGFLYKKHLQVHSQSIVNKIISAGIDNVKIELSIKHNCYIPWTNSQKLCVDFYLLSPFLLFNSSLFNYMQKAYCSITFKDQYKSNLNHATLNFQ